MLIITRRPGEKIMLGDDIVVHVMEIVGNSVRVGIQAPRSVPVYREEIWNAVREENRAAADSTRSTSRSPPSATPEAGAPRPRLTPPTSGFAAPRGRVRSRVETSTPDRQGATHGPNLPQAAAPRSCGGGRRRTAQARQGRGPAPGARPDLRAARAPPPPGPSNYDAPGPVANTATPVPAPEPQQPEAIDEAAEEAAAAAEAANIGGAVSDYAGPSDLPATEAERPLAEAGEGEAEGQEQAELDLREAAAPTAPGISDSERQIDETIEQAANPLAGEQLEGVRPAEDPRGDAEAVPPAQAPPAEPPPRAVGLEPAGAGADRRAGAVRPARGARRRAGPVRAADPGAARRRAEPGRARGEAEGRGGRLGLAHLVRADVDNP